jgi:chemotaxis protein MotB
MARKPYPEEPEQNDRWLVSYADFITLLFALFVVMYAVSSVQEHKVRQLSVSIGQALGKKVDPKAEHNTLPAPLAPELLPQSVARRNQSTVQREHKQMKGMALALDDRLSALVKQGTVRVTRSSRGISIEINAAILFAPADARLNPDSIAALQSIAEVLRFHPNAIEVEGHTDNRAIETTTFPSNWELSAARASRVVRLLIDAGIDERRLLAIGHAANRPVASNETTQGRLRNRRVEIQVLSGEPAQTKP